MRDIDMNLVRDILSRNEIEFAGLFGSRARGDENESSDVDILIRFKSGSYKSLLDLIHIQNEISDRLGTTVDLVTEASLSPYIKDYVVRDLKPIYGER